MSANYVEIPIINRMSEVLEIVMTSKVGYTSMELAGRIDIPKTTLYRLLASMRKNGFLQYDQMSGKYSMGRKFSFAYSLINEYNSGLKRLSWQSLQELSGLTGETVTLSILSGNMAYNILTVRGYNQFCINVDQGSLIPLHAIAEGKVLLSYMNDQETSHYMKEHVQAFTPKTICREETLRTELKLVKERGYAYDLEEYFLGTCGFAVPLRGSKGNVIASIGIQLSAVRYTPEYAWKLIAHLQTTSKKVEAIICEAVRNDEKMEEKQRREAHLASDLKLK